MVRLTARPDMTLDVYRGRKTTIQPTTKIRLSDGCEQAIIIIIIIKPLFSEDYI